MASIEERPSTVPGGPTSWRVIWYVKIDGRLRKRTVTLYAPEDAERARKIVEGHASNIEPRAVLGILGEIEEGDGNQCVPTLAEVADRYLASRTRLSPDSRGRYRRQLDTVVLPALGGHTPVDRIDGEAVAGMLNDLHNRYAASTVDRYFSITSAVLQWAHKELKVIDGNPADRTDHVRGQIRHDDASDEGDAHTYLEMWEYKLIADQLEGNDRALVEFLAATGCRWSEGTAVPVSAVRVDPPGVRIHRAWKRDDKFQWYLGATKGRQRRLVTLDEADIAALPDLSGRKPDDLVFTGPRGGRVRHATFAEFQWAPAVARASRCAKHPPADVGRRCGADELAGPLCGDNGGVRSRNRPCRRPVAAGWNRCALPAHRLVSPWAVSTCACKGALRKRPTLHDLRHSHISWLLQAGMTMLLVSRRAGHSSTEVTEKIYAHLVPDQLAEAGRVFRRMYGR